MSCPERFTYSAQCIIYDADSCRLAHVLCVGCCVEAVFELIICRRWLLNAFMLCRFAVLCAVPSGVCVCCTSLMHIGTHEEQTKKQLTLVR